MKPRFEPDAVLIDPEAYDRSEQRFAASLEAGRQARFVIDNSEPLKAAAEDVERLSGAAGESVDSDSSETNAPRERDARSESKNAETAAADPNAWRREVAARVNKYRARRRPQEPRYPSLMLKFEPPEFISDPAPEPAIADAPPSTESLYQSPSIAPLEDEESIAAPETAKIIEFPRPWSPPPPSPDELAEAISDRPRILEVPEVLPPPPVLGGMLIEPTEAAEAEKRPGIEIPLQSPPMSQRLLAAATDALIVFGACAIFGWSFVKVTGFVPALLQGAKTSLLLSAFFWAAYQYLMLVYTGSTPGLRLGKLRISRFDGVPATRSLRRWRVLASVLSGLSLGLGYAWCFLDEDGLCWHDRITHTYMAPAEDRNIVSAS